MAGQGWQRGRAASTRSGRDARRRAGLYAWRPLDAGVPHLQLRSATRLAALAALGLACAPAPPERGRVLLVGIDGAAPRIVRELLAAKRLPALGAIADAGVFGLLHAHKPILSPRIWTSMATGMHPRHHGIRRFAFPGPDGRPRLYTSTQRRVPALWNIASAAGLTVGVVNWWNSYPVERIAGVMVSDHVLPDFEARAHLSGVQTPGHATGVWPPEWDARVARLVADDASLSGLDDPFDDPDAPKWLAGFKLSRRWENDADVVRVALELEAAIRPDLLMVFLPGIDRVSHVLWASVEDPSAYPTPPSLSPEARAFGRSALERYYEYTDALIGKLVARFAATDLVLVVSDHGFEAGYGAGVPFLTGVHESDRALDGVILARGRDVARPQGAVRRVSVNDVTPTILHWLGLPVAQDMHGTPAPFVAGTPRTVASYRGTPVEREGEAASGAEPEILDQLEALGYLKGDGGG
jgi:predicted AlkP superfamily phosphohydrolase/phosphomutase